MKTITKKSWIQLIKLLISQLFQFIFYPFLALFVLAPIFWLILSPYDTYKYHCSNDKDCIEITKNNFNQIIKPNICVSITGKIDPSSFVVDKYINKSWIEMEYISFGLQIEGFPNNFFLHIAEGSTLGGSIKKTYNTLLSENKSNIEKEIYNNHFINKRNFKGRLYQSEENRPSFYKYSNSFNYEKYFKTKIKKDNSFDRYWVLAVDETPNCTFWRIFIFYYMIIGVIVSSASLSFFIIYSITNIIKKRKIKIMNKQLS